MADRSYPTSASGRWKRARRSAFVSTGRKCPRCRATIRAARTGPSPLPMRCMRRRNRSSRSATSPTPPLPMSPCRWQSPACCIGWSIRTPATPSWWSPRRRPVAASSSGRISSRSRCWDRATAEIASDKIILGRPGGLTLSSADIGAERAPVAVRPIFDATEWRKNQTENFNARQDELVAAAAMAEGDQRTPLRIDLARFYLSRGLYAEAKGVLDMALADAKPGLEDPVALIVHSVASSLIGRPEQGLKDLANPAIGTNYDSQLWKALACARLSKWAEAREKFKNVEFAITSLPMDLQRIVISEAMRASLEVKDYSGAAKRSSDLDVVGLTDEMKPAISVLRGRLAEALGHDMDALDNYRFAVGSPDRAAAAEATLDEIALQQKRDEISPAD